MHYYKVFFLSAILCTISFTPAFADEEELVSDDIFTELKIISDAESYYINNNLHYPLEDVSAFNNYEALADSASAVLKLFPDDGYALCCRSVSNYWLGKYKESGEEAAKIVCDPYVSEDAYGVIVALISKDSDVMSTVLKPYVEKAISDDGEENAWCNSIYLNLFAHIYLTQGNMKEAFRYAKLAYDKNPADALNALLPSTILIKSGHPKEAKNLLEPFISEGSEWDTSINHNYYLALRNDGHIKEAKKFLEQNIKDFPYDTSISFDYANLLASVGEYAKAIKTYDKLLEDLNNFEETIEFEALIKEIILRKAIILCVEGNREEGTRLINSILPSDTSNNTSGLECTMYAWLGDTDKAFYYLNQENIVSPSRYAAMYAITGDYPNALRYLKEAFEIHESNPSQTKYDLNFKGLISQPEYLELVKSYKSMEL